MGRQANFYIEREGFVQLAQLAVECGCTIIRTSDDGKLMKSKDTSIITGDCEKYYFYLPEAGKLDESLDLGCYNANGNVLVEAGYSHTDTKSKKIKRGRLYIMNGYTDGSGEFIPRPECLTKLYQRLVRRMKQITEHSVIPADKMDLRINYYADTEGRTHKIHIDTKLLKLVEKKSYILC